MSQYEGDLEEKKFLGSGGYVYAKLTEQEEIKANLVVPHLFLGRLSEDRFSGYYCNSCKKEYTGLPAISYESLNEEPTGEGLVEKGEYLCILCNNGNIS